MSKRLVTEAVAFALIGTLFETQFLVKNVPYIYESSSVIPAVPRAFGFVIIILTGYSLWMTLFGMQVGKARTKFRDLAEKAGEQDLERYTYPNLYVFGTSDNAKGVNNAQRAHQHVLETMTQMFFATLISGTALPLTTSVSTFLWAWGRIGWSKAYLQHGHSERYTHFLSTWIWRGLLINFLLSFITACSFLS